MTTRKIALRRIFRIVNGGTPTADSLYWNGGVPWATPADFGEQLRYLNKTRRTLSIEGVTSGSAMVPRGAILLSTRAPIGYVAIAARDMAFNQGCRALVPEKRVDSRFYGYQLESLVDELRSRGNGTTFAELSSDNLADLPLLAPELDSQRRIADFLDNETARIESLIRTRRRQRQVIAERRLALKDECVTYSAQQFSIEHPILGRISPEWPTIPLRRILKGINVGVVINPSHYFVDSGIPFIHGYNVREGWIDPSGMKFMTPESNLAHKRSQVREGDVLVVRAGAPGRAAVVTKEYDGANCASVLILRNSPGMDSAYLEAFLNSTAGKGQVLFSQYGAAQEVISANLVASFIIACPPIQEQKNRISKLHHGLEMTAQLDSHILKQISCLEERRRAIITAAVNGEFDVRSASGRGVLP